ncbi:sugar kinase [Variovorax sp. VNK109]|jgi:2-dehydro-3-deoxygluconokinase|uniref:sugar kinase n=1 Tax=Variovorax sp. VNK109 TaxID=3400919 RepID=UPI003C0B7605
MDKTFDVTALGEGMLEFNQTTPGEPQYLQGFGGDTSNAVIAAARAGARTAYLTRVGSDTFGRALLKLWAAEGVDTQAVESAGEAPTGIYFVTHGTRGHEFSYLRAGSAASRMTPAWLGTGEVTTPQEVIRQSRVLHASGISLAISPDACDTVFAAMKMARDAATLVSFDSNLRLKLWPLDRARACIAQAVALCDIFLPSLEDMTVLTGLSDADAIVDWGHAHGARIVALKLGAQGALVSDGTVREKMAAHPVQLVDATGAGDCFCGTLLAGIAQGRSLIDAAQRANAAAALAVQGYGAVAPLPGSADVTQFLARSGSGSGSGSGSAR